MAIQYILFSIIFFVAFYLVSLLLIPAAWIFGIIDKFKSIQNTSGMEKFTNIGIFIPFGIPVLILDL